MIIMHKGFICLPIFYPYFVCNSKVQSIISPRRYCSETNMQYLLNLDYFCPSLLVSHAVVIPNLFSSAVISQHFNPWNSIGKMFRFEDKLHNFALKKGHMQSQCIKKSSFNYDYIKISAMISKNALTPYLQLLILHSCCHLSIIRLPHITQINSNYFSSVLFQIALLWFNGNTQERQL